MRAVREITSVRLEIDFEMLTAELPTFERHLVTLTLDQVLNMWSEYIKSRRVQIRFFEFDEENKEAVGQGDSSKQQEPRSRDLRNGEGG